MSIIFVSDNHYLCQGVASPQIRAVEIHHSQDIQGFCLAGLGDKTIIIAFNNIILRREFIRKVKRYRSQCIIMLDELIGKDAFEIMNTVYSPMKVSQQHINDLAFNNSMITKIKLTNRELEMLHKQHLNNKVIARQLKISEKTVSNYRIRVQHKLRMKDRNTIAFLKIGCTIRENTPYKDFVPLLYQALYNSQ